jgi:molybdopterin-guanine dinucleotide biosynthesis protein A
MTGVILAGGKSSRLGRSKALQVIGDKSLIQWVIDHLVTISSDIVIVTAYGEPVPHLSHIATKVVADVSPGKGPLAGLYSGLMASSGSHAIVVGCDTPFLSTRLLEYMVQIRSTFDAVLPRIDNKLEPLCAVYSRSCLGSIRALLERNELSVLKVFDMVKVRYVEEDEINMFDPDRLSFFNINSQNDLERARRLATEKGWMAAVG